MNYQRPNKKRIKDVFNKKLPDRVPNFEVLVEDPTFSYVMGRPMPSNTFNNIPLAEYSELNDLHYLMNMKMLSKIPILTVSY